MKKIILFTFLVVILAVVKAQITQQNFSTPSTAGDTFQGTLLLSPSNNVGSNSNGPSMDVRLFRYHSFQFVTGANGLACTNYLDWSLDGQNWVSFYTNSTSATATNGTSLNQIVAYLRARFTGTNASTQVLYIGGR